jgi:hypothetical protein
MVCDCRCIAESINFQNLTIFSELVLSLALQSDPTPSQASCAHVDGRTRLMQEKCSRVRYTNSQRVAPLGNRNRLLGLRVMLLREDVVIQVVILLKGNIRG